jgi:Uma2 family endonuclease
MIWHRSGLRFLHSLPDVRRADFARLEAGPNPFSVVFQAIQPVSYSAWRLQKEIVQPAGGTIHRMDRPSDMQPARAEPIRLTYEDFLNFPDDGRRHELVDGDHYVTPAPVLRHQEISGELLSALKNYLRAHPIGRVYAAPADVVLSDFDVVEPDLLFVSSERRGILRDQVHGAPDLVVEIVSPASRRADEVTKRHLYDRAGVHEYWIVDPEIDVVKIHRRQDDGRFPRVAELARENGDRLESPLFPGFTLPLADLFG